MEIPEDTGDWVKTYCKNVDICSEEHLRACLAEFARHRRSKDKFSSFFDQGDEQIVEGARRLLESGNLHLSPLRYFYRIEPSNGKVRRIGCSSPTQQYLDYVAVGALKPLFDAKTGYHQCASVQGKGQRHARHYLKKWIQSERGARWYVKTDIRKFYPSVDREVLMSMLCRDVRNEKLLWLVERLVMNHDSGLNIGSFLSQHLANYYLSGVYREAEGAKRERRRRDGTVVETRLCDHVLAYMDDWCFIGPDKSNLKSLVRKVEREMSGRLHLEVKPWKVCSVDDEPLDMCGYVFRRDRVTVRPGTFLRARRAFLRAGRAEEITPMAAGRCISYYGTLKHADCLRFRRENDVDGIARRCKEIISENERRKATQ